MKSVSSQIKADICVIGAGSGGLSVAAGAARLGVKTVLIEKAEMGGDCLNYGCVPSKSLIAAGKHAHAMTSGAAFGVAPERPRVDFARVRDHIREVIAAIEPNDSQERFEGLGVTVIRGVARFVGPDIVEAEGKQIKARRVVIATGSSPAVPPIRGLSDVSFFTNETIFDNEVLPQHLVVVGGGPIGVELSQAYRRLGADVTLIEMAEILSKDDPELKQVITDRLREEGIDMLTSARVTSVRRHGQGSIVVVEKEGSKHEIHGMHLLIAAGRKPNTDSLGLEEAGIAYDKSGIKVDARLRTTNKKVFAIGDVTGGLQFTHVAGYHAGIVIRNALFRLPAKSDTSVSPWVTYTDPEIANVGLTEAQAREKFGNGIRILKWPLEDNDRAQAERSLRGLAKIVTTARGRILGAGIAAPNAGELIQPWTVALYAKLKIGAMANYIAPYPTMGEISKRAAGSFYTPTLFSTRTRWLVRLLSKLG